MVRNIGFIIDLRNDECHPEGMEMTTRLRRKPDLYKWLASSCMLDCRSKGVAMAEKTVLVCDRCGGEDAQRVQVVVGSRRLVTDLCPTHLAELTSTARPRRRGRPSSIAAKSSARRPSAKASTTKRGSERARRSNARSSARGSNRNPDVADEVNRLRNQGLSYRQVGDVLMERGIKPRRAARWNPIVLSRMVKRTTS